MRSSFSRKFYKRNDLIFCLNFVKQIFIKFYYTKYIYKFSTPVISRIFLKLCCPIACRTICRHLPQCQEFTCWSPISLIGISVVLGGYLRCRGICSNVIFFSPQFFGQGQRCQLAFIPVQYAILHGSAFHGKALTFFTVTAEGFSRTNLRTNVAFFWITECLSAVHRIWFQFKGREDDTESVSWTKLRR